MQAFVDFFLGVERPSFRAKVVEARAQRGVKGLDAPAGVEGCFFAREQLGLERCARAIRFDVAEFERWLGLRLIEQESEEALDFFQTGEEVTRNHDCSLTSGRS